MKYGLKLLIEVSEINIVGWSMYNECMVKSDIRNKIDKSMVTNCWLK